MIRYRFIVIEGPDGSGKTTISKELKKRLREVYSKVYLIKEPSDNITGIFSKNFMDYIDINNFFDNISLSLIFAADRYYNQKLIKEKLEDDYIIISDRYFYSAFIYQSIGNKIDIEWLKNIYRYIIKPDITFIIDADDDIIIKRLSKRRKLNLYEKDYIKDVINGYKKLKDIFPDHNIVYIDNNGFLLDTMDKIFSYIL